MTLNPLLNSNTHEPLRMEGEYFIIRRNDCEFEFVTEHSGKYNANGFVILSSVRLIAISPDLNNINFKSFEMPLSNIYGEAYNQPFFGRNFLSGTCQSLFASPLGKVTFRIWFKANDCGTIVPALYNLLDSLRHNQNRTHDKHIINGLKNGDFNSIFAIDPKDPSFIYTTQPEAIPLPKSISQSVIPGARPNMMLSGVNNNLDSQNNYGGAPVNHSMFVNYGANNNNQFVYQEPPKFQYKEPNYQKEEIINPYVPKHNQKINIIQNNENKVFPLIPENEISRQVINNNNKIVVQGKVEEVPEVRNVYPQFDQPKNLSYSVNNNSYGQNNVINPYVGQPQILVNNNNQFVPYAQPVQNVQSSSKIQISKDNGGFSLLNQDQNFNEPLIDPDNKFDIPGNYSVN